MDLLNIFALNLFIDILPDGVLSTLSTNSKLVNNLVYYDNNSLDQISKILNHTNKQYSYVDQKISLNIITHIEGPNKLVKVNIKLSNLLSIEYFDFSKIK